MKEVSRWGRFTATTGENQTGIDMIIRPEYDFSKFQHPRPHNLIENVLMVPESSQNVKEPLRLEPCRVFMERKRC